MLKDMEGYLLKYGKEVYSFCAYLTRNKEDTDDLYQQTFLVAIEKKEIDEGNNPKSYLISIAANIWRNHKRKYLWRKKKIDITFLENEDMESIADQKEAICDTLIKKEEITSVRECVYQLPEKMKVVVLMRYMENMSLEEIAERLKIPYGTVQSRMHKAKLILKERMEHLNEG